MPEVSALIIRRLGTGYVLSLSLLVSLLAITAAKSLAAKEPIVIKMLDTPPSFQPVRTTINAGDTVEWKNVGNEVHHATSDPSLAITKTDVTNPTGAKPFDSGFLKPGDTFKQTFSIPGVYRYTCVVHETKGMTGEIIVHN
jgi:plastocyanin